MTRPPINGQRKHRPEAAQRAVRWVALAIVGLIAGIFILGEQETLVENEAAPHMVTINEPPPAPRLRDAIAWPTPPAPASDVSAVQDQTAAPLLPPGKFPDASQSRPGDM